MLTGSIASSLQGEPRATHDIDLVVRLESAAVPALLAAFPPGEFHLDEQAVHRAIESKSMFNVLEPNEGDKIDFWLLTDSPFDRSRFARRYPEHVFGFEISVSSPEDTILAKLHWAKLMGGSEKHIQDALRVYEVQGTNLDDAYLDRWARELSVLPLWERLQSEGESV